MAAGLRIVPVRVNHLVPTVGFLISDERTTILYSGDTYQTEDLWRAASSMPSLKAAFIEVSYPNPMGPLPGRRNISHRNLWRENSEKLAAPIFPSMRII
jgi:hypothetical protein